MNRIATLLICLVLSPQVAWADGDAKPKAAVPEAEVLSDKCTFKFPIDDIDRVWKWGVSAVNHCEYLWMVTVKRGDTSYQLGFSYFNPDAVPQSGSLAKLLATGQANVWKLAADGTGATYVAGVRVTCRVARDHLVIVVHNKVWTEELFGDKPKTVQFETGGTQLERTKTTVTVDYQLDHKESDQETGREGVGSLYPEQSWWRMEPEQRLLAPLEC